MISRTRSLAMVLLLLARETALGADPAPAGGDHPAHQYSARAWQMNEGLPNNRVLAIAQTRDGFLWVGTGEGLARFDGKLFSTFDSRSTPAIQNSAITALLVERTGALWIGTGGGGLTRLDHGEFSHVGRAEGLVGEYVTAICQTPDGALWFGTEAGLNRLKADRFTCQRREQGLLANEIQALLPGADGSLWIASAGGLNRLRGTNLESFNVIAGRTNLPVRCLREDRSGRLWLGTDQGLICRDQGRFVVYDAKAGLTDNFVSAIWEDKETNLWVGNFSGLSRFRDGRFEEQLNNQGMPFDRINTLFEDYDGGLWAGSKEGLLCFSPRRFSNLSKKEGLTHNNIMSVLEDRNQTLWIATWGGGLDAWRDGQVSARAVTNGFPADQLLALCEARDGGLWVGADLGGGLIKLKDGQTRRYTAEDGLPGASVRVIHEDRAGRVWVGTSAGLGFLEDGKFTICTARDGLAGREARAICEAQDGGLWFGTEAGLNRWEKGHFTHLTGPGAPLETTVTALYEDRDLNLWVGTANRGLIRLRNGKFNHFTAAQGLYSDEIFEILDDDQGWLWLSCSKGIFRVLKLDLDSVARRETTQFTSIAYGKEDGLESVRCNGAAKPGGWHTHDGRLWFATSKGLVSFDPKAIRINKSPPPVYVEQVIADKQPLIGVVPVMWNEPSPQTVASIPEFKGSLLRVPAGRGELEFDFTVLNFEAPEKSRFKFQLEGVDLGWQDAGNRRAAYYNNLYPASYRFRVIACNKDGVWSEEGASLVFEILPHVWQTWWFRISSVVLVIGGVGGAVRYFTRARMQRELELLEKDNAIEHERSRIAQDMHDQLGAGLTQLGLLGELARRTAGATDQAQTNAGEICQLTRELAQTLDEIVWTVNPKNDTLNKLAAYIALYTEDFFRTAGVNCRMDIPPGLPHCPLSAELRHNLLLAVKEAANNVVKHAGAAEVWVRFALLEGALDVSIQDDGRGFDPATAGAGRNGLASMQKRLEEVRGRFRLSSVPGGGTTVHFTVPLPNMETATGS